MTFSLVYIFINYITLKYDVIPNSDISEIPIVASYIIYVILYICVIRLYLKGEIQGVGKGLIVPLIAAIGSLTIIIGGLQNPMTFLYLGICGVVVLIALRYLHKKSVA